MPNPKYQSHFTADDVDNMVGASLEYCNKVISYNVKAADWSTATGTQYKFKYVIDSSDIEHLSLASIAKVYIVRNNHYYDISYEVNSVEGGIQIIVFSNIAFPECDIYVVGTIPNNNLPDYNISYIYGDQRITNLEGMPTTYRYESAMSLPTGIHASWCPPNAIIYGYSLTDDYNEIIDHIPFEQYGNITLYVICEVPVYYKDLSGNIIDTLSNHTYYRYPIDDTANLCSPYHNYINDIYIRGWSAVQNAGEDDIVTSIDTTGKDGYGNKLAYAYLNGVYATSGIEYLVNSPSYYKCLNENIGEIPPDDPSMWSAVNKWDKNNQYNIGDVVYVALSFTGYFYKSLIDNNTASPLSSDSWEEITYTIWMDNRAYSVGDVVSYGQSCTMNYYHGSDSNIYIATFHCNLPVKSIGKIMVTPDQIRLWEDLYDIHGTPANSAELLLQFPAYDVFSVGFSCSTTINKIYVPYGVERIGIDDSTLIQPFMFCYQLTEVVLPETITSIRGGFTQCFNLRKITIPNNIDRINSGMFQGCYRLSEVIIGEGVTTIQGNAFSSCCNLTNITLGSSVETIANGAFSSCDKLVEIYNKSQLQLEPGSSQYGGIALHARNIYTPTSGHSNLQNIDNFIVYTDDINSDLEAICYIGDDVIVTTPNGVGVVGSGVFACTPVVYLTLNDDVRYLLGGLLSKSKIKGITLNSGLINIADNVYNDDTISGILEIYNKSRLNIKAGNTDYGMIGYFAQNVYGQGEEAYRKIKFTNGYITYNFDAQSKNTNYLTWLIDTGMFKNVSEDFLGFSTTLLPMFSRILNKSQFDILRDLVVATIPSTTMSTALQNNLTSFYNLCTQYLLNISAKDTSQVISVLSSSALFASMQNPLKMAWINNFKYNIYDIVHYSDLYYISRVDNNTSIPTDNTKWVIVNDWRSDISYTTSNFTSYQGRYYTAIADNIAAQPDISPDEWVLINNNDDLDKIIIESALEILTKFNQALGGGEIDVYELFEEIELKSKLLYCDPVVDSGAWEEYVDPTSNNDLWNEITVAEWDSGTVYSIDDYVHLSSDDNYIIYRSLVNSNSDIPSPGSAAWERKYVQSWDKLSNYIAGDIIYYDNSTYFIASHNITLSSTLQWSNDSVYSDYYIVSFSGNYFYKKSGSTQLHALDPGLLQKMYGNSLIGYSGLSQSINIPSTINSIYHFAFEFDNVVSSITLNSNMLPLYAFEFYNAFKISNISIPNTCQSLSYGFAVASSLKNIEFQSNSVLNTVGPHAFDECTGLYGINLPNSCAIIHSHAFTSCLGLRRIIFPESLIHIGNNSFTYVILIQLLGGPMFAKYNAIQNSWMLTKSGSSSVSLQAITASGDMSGEALNMARFASGQNMYAAYKWDSFKSFTQGGSIGAIYEYNNKNYLYVFNPNFGIVPGSTGDELWNNYTLYYENMIVMHNNQHYCALEANINTEPIFYNDLSPLDNTLWSDLNIPIWDSSTTYNEGDMVCTGNSSMYFTSKIQNNVGHDPSDSSTFDLYWDVENASNWYESSGYSVGDIVFYNQRFYEAIVNIMWRLVEQWDSAKTYNYRDAVLYNNILYMSASDNNNSAPPTNWVKYNNPAREIVEWSEDILYPRYSIIEHDSAIPNLFYTYRTLYINLDESSINDEPSYTYGESRPIWRVISKWSSDEKWDRRKYDIVLYNNKAYESLVDDNTSTPGSDPNKWSEVNIY